MSRFYRHLIASSNVFLSKLKKLCGITCSFKTNNHEMYLKKVFSELLIFVVIQKRKRLYLLKSLNVYTTDSELIRPLEWISLNALWNEYSLPGDRCWNETCFSKTCAASDQAKGGNPTDYLMQNRSVADFTQCIYCMSQISNDVQHELVKYRPTVVFHVFRKSSHRQRVKCWKYFN